MGYRNGRLYGCDRCGETVFCLCTGEEEADGGFTRWNTFVPLPSGWKNHDIGLFCPGCNGVYGEWIERFMGGDADDV